MNNDVPLSLDLTKTLNSLAKRMNMPLTRVGLTTAEFVRQGLDPEDIAKRTEDALILMIKSDLT